MTLAAMNPPGAAQLGDGESTASVPDFFRSIAHDLFVIGALYRAAGDKFNRTLTACAKQDAKELAHALSNVRANARRIDELGRELERKLDAMADMDDCREVYRD